MSTAGFASTPEPPYYAVIFTSTRTSIDEGYAGMADRMVELASQQPGFLGVESVRGADGLGITVSYWSSPEAIVGVEGECRTPPRTGIRASQMVRTLRDARGSVERAL
jgi:hypothetical protein